MKEGAQFGTYRLTVSTAVTRHPPLLEYNLVLCYNGLSGGHLHNIRTLRLLN